MGKESLYSNDHITLNLHTWEFWSPPAEVFCALQNMQTEVLWHCWGRLALSSGDKGDFITGIIEEMYVKYKVSCNLCLILLCNFNLQLLCLSCKW